MVQLATEELPAQHPGLRGVVTVAPAGLGKPFSVICPNFSTEHAFQIRYWTARGLTVPAAGDEVLVLFDDDSEPWVAAWWPAAGDTVVAPGPAPVTLARAATTAALATNTLTGNVLEATANGALAAQDGVTLAVGDRLLVKNEGEGKKNGVYEVTSLGAAGAKYVLTRIASLNESSEIVGGMEIRVLQGTRNAATAWALTTTGAIVLGTTALTFTLAGKENPVSASTEDLRIIRGIVNMATPTIVKGEGFTVTKTTTGRLTVNFTVAFADIPSVNVSTSDGTHLAPIMEKEPTVSAAFVVGLATTFAAADCIFHFTATGPR